jgi:hypothetical protein
MFRFLRLVIYLGVLGAFIWFGTTVQLGRRTLFGHLGNIWKTHESQDLVDGTKERVGGLVDQASDRVVKGVGKNTAGRGSSQGELPGKQGAAPMEDVQGKDRKALRGILGRGLDNP